MVVHAILCYSINTNTYETNNDRFEEGVCDTAVSTPTNTDLVEYFGFMQANLLARVKLMHPVGFWATWCQQEWNFWVIQLKLIMLLLADMKIFFNYPCAGWITIWFYSGIFAS